MTALLLSNQALILLLAFVINQDQTHGISNRVGALEGLYASLTGINVRTHPFGVRRSGFRTGKRASSWESLLIAVLRRRSQARVRKVRRITLELTTLR